jgi:hypothetical protein
MPWLGLEMVGFLLAAERAGLHLKGDPVYGLLCNTAHTVHLQHIQHGMVSAKPSLCSVVTEMPPASLRHSMRHLRPHVLPAWTHIRAQVPLWLHLQHECHEQNF